MTRRTASITLGIWVLTMPLSNYCVHHAQARTRAGTKESFIPARPGARIGWNVSTKG
jgi:hypothetical protein